jgi:hypothetical protein
MIVHQPYENGTGELPAQMAIQWYYLLIIVGLDIVSSIVINGSHWIKGISAFI